MSFIRETSQDNIRKAEQIIIYSFILFFYSYHIASSCWISHRLDVTYLTNSEITRFSHSDNIRRRFLDRFVLSSRHYTRMHSGSFYRRSDRTKKEFVNSRRPFVDWFHSRLHSSESLCSLCFPFHQRYRSRRGVCYLPDVHRRDRWQGDSRLSRLFHQTNGHLRGTVRPRSRPIRHL